MQLNNNMNSRFTNARRSILFCFSSFCLQLVQDENQTSAYLCRDNTWIFKGRTMSLMMAVMY